MIYLAGIIVFVILLTAMCIPAIVTLGRVEKAYEEGISKTDFLNAYRKFKNVVGTKSEEKQIDKEFQDVSGYSIYKVFKASQENDWIKL